MEMVVWGGKKVIGYSLLVIRVVAFGFIKELSQA